MSNTNETILEVDLNKLKHNYYYLKSLLKDDCKIIAVVKAFAYGHGDIVISKTLENLGVETFWVADFEEGIILREGGIKSKIIVANPGRKSFNEIIKNNLDVVLHNKNLLDFYISKSANVNVHIKFNTGMNRYGFNVDEIEEISEKIKNHKQLKVVSVCSHLSSADDLSKSKATLNQIKLFEKTANRLEENLSCTLDKHILNSNGFLHFPEKLFDMVRLGITLFGSYKNKNLLQVSKLKSVISQNRNIKKGAGVGYSSGFEAVKDMNISVVPIGYADGLNRGFGDGKGNVLVNGVLCPIIGNICMDSFMIDTSEVSCKEGDEVEIFGGRNSILKLSEDLGTIPYEIYSTLNRRIKRVYIDN
ncbi:MAG: alanine racemase [Flavobacteriales bacterium]|nr:alanine racemase [Flavobacteriales bacterium]